jgi:hypothetical protein
VKEHGAPCVVLVINNNLYGLMFALSYICRTCPYTMLEPYVGFKVVRRSKWRTLNDDQCVIQGNIRRMVICELSLLQLCLEEYNWVDICVYLQDIIIMKEEEMIQGWSSQSAKMGFKLINSQSIHNVSSGILWSQTRIILSGDHLHRWEVKFKMSHLKEIICLMHVFYLVVMAMWIYS